jgi:hypothetical protein
MTGITGTGPGQTPFTGITGYYTAIDANPLLTLETVNYIAETPNLSGLRFFCPVSLSRLEMEYIDIGNSNIINGYVTGINIGSENYIYSKNQTGFYNTVILTGITGTAPGQTPFTGITGYENVLVGVLPKDRNFNLGSFNSITNTNLGNNFGLYNTINSGYNLFQIGSNLSSLGIENSTSIGSLNSISSGSNILILGNNNITENSNSVGLLGRGNYLNNYAANIIGDANDLSQGIDGGANILGNSNIIENSNDTNILGNNNYLSGTTSSFVVGTNNYSQSTSGGMNTDIFILGSDSAVIESSDQIIFGNSIFSTNSSNNTLFGKNISSIGNGNISFGAQNIINSNYESIYGISNVVNNSNFDFIAGGSNSLSGTNNNSIFGSNNRADRYLLDSLYLQELTGITGKGAGQTPFTGVTGFVINGGYSGIDPVGGDENFIVGQNNLTTLNYGVYAFGNDNRLLNNTDTYVFGAYNFAEKSNNSYIIGEQNSVSGFKNYVIGNNNTIRSGDYNSIFIGISNDSYGENKVNSVNIGSLNSNIEVSPSNIKLVSPNSRPKINDENIIITSDLNSYLKSSNGLSNSQAITPYNNNTFNDGSYFGIPNQIEIQPFFYSGDREGCGAEFTSWTYGYGIQTFDGRFIKRDATTYAGNYYPLTDYYFQSKTEDYRIVFSDIGVGTGSWLIVTDVGGGLGLLPIFYNTGSIDSPIDSSNVPSYNWTGMTFEDPLNPYYGYISFLSGLEPYPIVEYFSSSTGILDREKMNAVSNINHNAFYNMGTLGYTSVTQGISVIYGMHTSSQFNASWIVIDNYSSGMYAINRSGSFNSFPQSGWISTGFFGFTGWNIYNKQNPLETPNPLTKISLSKSGLISSSDPVLGKIYIPFLY